MKARSGKVSSVAAAPPIARLALALALLAAVGPLDPGVRAAEGKAVGAPALAVGDWLQLGPVVHRLPAFHDAEERGFDLDALMEAVLLPGRRPTPRSGETVTWFGGETLHWRATSGEQLTWSPPSGDAPALAWAATYVSNDRWMKLKVAIDGTQRRHVWVDGRSVAKGAEESVSGTVELEPGLHRILVQAVHDPEAEAAEWKLGLSFSDASDEGGAADDADASGEAGTSGKPDADVPPALEVSTVPRRGVEMADITDAPTVSSIALAPDGRLAALGVRRIVPGTDDGESWIELRDTTDGRLLDSWRGRRGAGQLSWSPDGRWLAFVSAAASGKGPSSDGASGEGASGEGASDLLLMDVASREVRPLLEGVAKFGGYSWGPDGKSVVFSIRDEKAPFKDGVKRVEELRDRWATFRTKSHLHLATVPEGVRRRLTAGDKTTSTAAISPDGERLLFTRSRDRADVRPYTITEVWEMDLRTLETRRLRELAWVGGFSFSPDGRRLLVSGAPDTFGDGGEAVGRGAISNGYDTQLFIWELAADRVTPISRDFDPSVSSAEWSHADGRIYVVAEERDFRKLYRYDESTGRFDSLETGVDAFGSLTLARDAPVALGTGTSPWVPERLVAVDLESDRARALPHPGDAWWRDVEMGDLFSWTFEASSGTEIDGRVYLPPGFDRDRKYPLIVYYYGGTSPTGRGFGGRYPKEWWAANGYVVYVLQPSGATGFGQEFSARHVNDWGKTSSEEIIEGTRQFLAAHPFVDPDRVGCIGASYGGFMTMLLSTKTDLFAGAVAHAGISSISSYWGEGNWGYLYSAVATAESFPWNRRDIYVDQSPLFRADQNRVPILLTHGVDDTNVPVGESDQFFVALKLLGKEVDYLQVEGEDHWILGHAKRHRWSKSILAWFDRRLKGDATWWDALYED